MAPAQSRGAPPRGRGPHEDATDAGSGTEGQCQRRPAMQAPDRQERAEEE